MYILELFSDLVESVAVDEMLSFTIVGMFPLSTIPCWFVPDDVSVLSLSVM